jgi:hypothetical protein
MVNIRVATIGDLAELQNANLQCLPENYQMKSDERAHTEADRREDKRARDRLCQRVA